MKRGKVLVQAALAILLAGTLLMVPETVHGQNTITLNSTAQEVTVASPNGVANGNCTLGEAILAANTNAAVDACTAGGSGGTDTIVIPAGTYTIDQLANNAGFFVPASGTPPLTGSVTFEGAGAATTFLERSSAPGTPTFSLFNAINAGGLVTINKLSIRNLPCNGGAAGGAVMYYSSPVTINDSVIENNQASGSCGGGGGLFKTFNIFTGLVTINNSLFRNNTGGDVTATVLESPGPVTITNSTFQNNTPVVGFAAAGPLALLGDGPFNISNSLFVGNIG
ncbi:MAG: hypothetical protein ACRD2Y_14415, partial [Terriglobales bacterium]